MNECLTTLQHEKQIGYWVSEQGKCMKWLCYLIGQDNANKLNSVLFKPCLFQFTLER